MINDSYQKISDDRLMKCNDSSGMISDSFRRLGFVTSDSFFFLCVSCLYMSIIVSCRIRLQPETMRRLKLSIDQLRPRYRVFQQTSVLTVWLFNAWSAIQCLIEHVEISRSLWWTIELSQSNGDHVEQCSTWSPWDCDSSMVRSRHSSRGWMCFLVMFQIRPPQP